MLNETTSSFRQPNESLGVVRVDQIRKRRTCGESLKKFLPLGAQHEAQLRAQSIKRAIVNVK